MNDVSSTFTLGARARGRLGYGAMQLAGSGAFGPPRDRSESIAVLREAVARGVDHLDTSHAYGPHVTNQLIREALHPYPEELLIATKVGGTRGEDGAWLRADSAAALRTQVEDNLRHLGLDVLELVNLRVMLDPMRAVEGSIEAPLTALLALQREGKVRHIGLSHATPTQVAEARTLGEIACVQNLYNLAHRGDDALIDALARDGIAYVPFFPLGGFSPLQSTALSRVARELDATPMQVALAWLLQRAPNVMPIPGTSRIAHLRENLGAARLSLTPDQITTLEPG
ncbi:MAG: oxidoreductase [Deltaproteobacteria bacterium]|nr:oxidoreductase [Deltaproteobacteria bacterium]